jgi:predicted nucleic acid-binding Zn ribbon protein
MMMRKNDQKLGDILNTLVRDPKFKPKLYQKKIEQTWQDMMGVWINRETRSIRVKDGTLTIKISSSALREELHFMRDKIKEKINGMLGEDFIKEVVVK